MNFFSFTVLVTGLLVLLSVPSRAILNQTNTEASEEYVFYTAFDSASWAITTTNKLSPVLGEHVQSKYDNFILGCNVATYKGDSPIKARENEQCNIEDADRTKKNREQPVSVYNFTKEGYKKIRAPTELFSLIKEYWRKNRDLAEPEFDEMNVFYNGWESPTTIAHIGHEHTGGSPKLEKKIYNLTRPLLEEWTGQYLSPVSVYGIRIYQNGSILAPHVDRMPLVTSAIILVDQDVDEPWPLEVYGHDGKATNVTMEPGDMVLYESHSVIHGRPFPMVGKYFANLFVHFEPLAPLEGGSCYDPELGLPPYLIPGSSWEKEWRSKHPQGWRPYEADVLLMAKSGNTEKLKEIVRYNPNAIHKADEKTGWTALHAAVRSGIVEVAKFILDQGADKNLLTGGGFSPLFISYKNFGEKHPMTQFLESIGAQNIKPRMKQKIKRKPNQKEEL
mmetsp:Transcript_4709/g.7336  ORF Transcript_4709/g.7336 Transcript_4709/m.7336 type:complete len:447 (+) Transcript_4709:128-1468(+)